jgi:hypothetical protein
MWQKPDRTPLEFIKQVKAQADVINVHEGQAGFHPELYKAHLAEWMAINNETAAVGASDASKKAATESSCEEYLACYAVRTADNTRFKDLKNELDNDFLKGKNCYPKKMEDALRLMQNHKSAAMTRTAGRGKGHDRNQSSSQKADEDEKGVNFGKEVKKERGTSLITRREKSLGKEVKRKEGHL